MKTLLEKAKPQLLAGIVKYETKYPSLAEHIKESLGKLYFVNHMTIATWTDVRSIWFEETGELNNHPWGLFKED